MRILHICSDYANQSLYNQLVTNLSKNNIYQKIYIPVRSKEEVGKNINEKLKNVDYYYSHILNKLDRLNYYSKIRKTTKNLLSLVDIDDIQCTHAHFLFSDGGIAYNLKSEFNIPYIVAVRNTDLNFFFRYYIHLRKKGIQILKNASKIIFLSYAYRDQLFEHYISSEIKDELWEKTEVVPNGVDSYWQENVWYREASQLDSIKLLYVGDFSKNKNIHVTVEAVKKLNKEVGNVYFTIIGGGGNYANTIKKIASQNVNITIIDRINDKKKLMKLFRENDIFIMPSTYETFGLVYIEAMSQGLPVIYSKGQGIDQYFEEGEVGYSVKSGNSMDILKKVIKISENFDSISSRCSERSLEFSWERICKINIEIYRSVIKTIS